MESLWRTQPVGDGAALAFGLALMALSPSSSGVGQIVMAGFMNWLCCVRIAGHYCTNRAAQAPRHTGRQTTVPETPEQRVPPCRELVTLSLADSAQERCLVAAFLPVNRWRIVPFGSTTYVTSECLMS